MYWYYKLLLAVVGGLVLLGIGWGVRSYASRPKTPTTAQAAPELPPSPGPTGAPAAPSGPTARGPASAEVQQKIAIARGHQQKGDLLTARKLLDNALSAPGLTVYSADWLALAEAVGAINTELLLTDAPCPEKIDYTVLKGDSLWAIAKRFSTTIAMLQKGNRLNETNPTVFPGQVLHIYQGQWRIEVSKAEYLLTLRDGNRIVKVYHVGLGKQDRTPVGTFVIENKQREPAWTPPGKNIPYGHPDNVLGTRWMGLKPDGTTPQTLTGYGIHGTWEPDSIGKPTSNGCVRMVNAQVEELFDLVPEKVPVVLTN